MFTAVSKRFSQFHNNILLTDAQKTDGATKHHGVRKCLNAHYYGSSSETANSFLVGSWGKYTRVRPPRDIDVCFVLPDSVYYRFNNHSGNKQSALLQEVKSVLQRTYTSTDMRGDGQVVVVKFATMNVEVVPAFTYTNYQYLICDTNNGGRYKAADPKAEERLISAGDEKSDKNLRAMIRMLKAWQRHCSVPIKSFHLELLVEEFLAQSQYRAHSYHYYDYLFRDFFRYLQGKENQYLFAPGTYETMALGNAWKSKCDSAYARALKACDYEYQDYIYLAGEEWQKIFGDQIPIAP